ncbi:MAG: SurA N-terminal domain-containing protein, partial [Pseudohongiellaceae bacterium]
MLQKIRDNSQGLLAKIFVFLIAAVFGLFGIEYLVGSFINSTPSVTVNGVDIDETEIQMETQRRTQELLSSMGPDADFSQIDDELIREMALNTLIQQQLLYQKALHYGMVVAPAAIDRQIASIPEFQVDGVFNNQQAQLILSSGGYTPSTFRQALEREGLLNQLLMAYSESGFITPLELETIAALTEQKRDFRYLLLNFQDQAGELEISDADIQTYYDNNSEQFMREEQVAIEYLVLDKNALFDEIQVSDAEVEAQYQRELETFQTQIERRASHILLEATASDEVNAARDLAAELKERLDAGESFAELALEYSDDLGSAEDGGDVGYTNGDSFVEEFEAALRELEVNEVSDPVVTEFGVHLIKLTEISSSEFETLEQARERIRRDLQEAEVQLLYVELAEQLGNLSFESVDLADPAEIMDMEIQRSELFGRSGGLGIAANPAVIEAAFSLDVLEDRL